MFVNIAYVEEVLWGITKDTSPCALVQALCSSTDSFLTLVIYFSMVSSSVLAGFLFLAEGLVYIRLHINLVIGFSLTRRGPFHDSVVGECLRDKKCAVHDLLSKLYLNQTHWDTKSLLTRIILLRRLHGYNFSHKLLFFHRYHWLCVPA